ncbi:hypothetical protein JCM8097_006249 [Rhodosporidiobolus ruineniae]
MSRPPAPRRSPTLDELLLPMNDQPGASSSSSSAQAAGPTKRKRAAVACEGCRSRRSRCDGGQPCSTCAGLGHDCVYQAPTLQAPPGYVESLELRVAELQAQLSTLGSGAMEKEDSPIPVEGPKSRKPSKPVQPREAGPFLGSGRAIARRLAALRAFSPSSTPTSSSLPFAFPGSPASQASGSAGTPGPIPPPANLPPPAPVPNEATGRELVQACMAHIALRFPILHPPSFEKMHASFRAGDPSPTIRTIVNLVYAIGARTTGKGSGEPYLAAALSTFDDALSAPTSLDTVVVLLLLSAYALRHPRGPGAWTLSGAALTRAITLSLHQEQSTTASAILGLSENNLSALDVEMRRRIWWSCFSLEITIAVMLGRPPGIADVDITTPLPADVDMSISDADLVSHYLHHGAPPLPSSSSLLPLTVAVRSFEIRRIEAKILEKAYRHAGATEADLFNLMAELTLWWTNSPAFDASRPHFAHWFEMRYHAAVLLLNSPSLLKAAPGDPVVRTCAKASPSQLAGITLLLCLRLSPTSSPIAYSDLITAITDCRHTLELYSHRWPAAAAHLEIFREVAAETLAPLLQRQREDAAVAALVSVGSPQGEPFGVTAGAGGGAGGGDVPVDPALAAPTLLPSDPPPAPQNLLSPEAEDDLSRLLSSLRPLLPAHPGGGSASGQATPGYFSAASPGATGGGGAGLAAGWGAFSPLGFSSFFNPSSSGGDPTSPGGGPLGGRDRSRSPTAIGEPTTSLGLDLGADLDAFAWDSVAWLDEPAGLSLGGSGGGGGGMGGMGLGEGAGEAMGGVEELPVPPPMDALQQLLSHPLFTSE